MSPRLDGIGTSCSNSCPGDGWIDERELHIALDKMRMGLSRGQIRQLMQVFDADGNHLIDKKEFRAITSYIHQKLKQGTKLKRRRGGQRRAARRRLQRSTDDRSQVFLGLNRVKHGFKMDGVGEFGRL